MVVLPAIVGATPAQTETASKLPASTIGGGTVLEMIAILTGVILLILILGWLIKRFGSFPAAGKGMVKILGGVSLGPRERAVVLEAGDKRVLVGVAPGRVQTLCMLGESDESSIEEFSSQLDAQLQSDEK
jgi:flagellar protein FliO/FliZ